MKASIVSSKSSLKRDLDKFRILIVEDNGLFRQALREGLQLSFPGIAIDEATNGAEALQRVKGCFPDLILMDIRLPRESGLGLTHQIKALHPEIVICIVSNYDVPEYRSAAFRYGADHFVAKESFNRMQLEELVRSYYKC